MGVRPLTSDTGRATMQRRVWPEEAEQENKFPLAELDTDSRSGVVWGPQSHQAQKNTRRLVEEGDTRT